MEGHKDQIQRKKSNTKVTEESKIKLDWPSHHELIYMSFILGYFHCPASLAAPLDRRISSNLPRGAVNLIGGELDVDEPRLQTNRTSQSLHHCSIGYHPCNTNDLATKAYPCKQNQEHKQEQEMQSNQLGYEMGSHKPMNGDTV
jgi:hypothetical protein